MSEANANEYPFCPTTSLVLVLDNGWKQRALPGGGWQDIEAMPEPLKVYGLTSIKQEINEPGWRFDAIFRDFGNSSLAQAKTGWDYSAENAAVLYATSAVDYSENQPQVILTTNANESTRILWRAWSIEMLVRAPKWRSNDEREADIAAHETRIRRDFSPVLFPDHWPSATKPSSIEKSLDTFEATRTQGGKNDLKKND
ncbi:MAG: hypothetical protein P4L77_11585 [Sulfuriferula sp.]|nr:hypothetical protein [Sulfuriferula sp.]